MTRAEVFEDKMLMPSSLVGKLATVAVHDSTSSDSHMQRFPVFLHQ